MPDETRVILSADLHGFFREEVVLAGRHLGLRLTDSIEYYVVQLLTEFSYREDVADMYRDEPLIVLHQRASQAPAAEQFTIFKQLGDWALYVAGFFAEFIERSLVTLEYYSAMGTAAYRNVAALCGQTHKPAHLQGMYRELSHSFATVVDVLTQVSHRARQRNGNDIDLLKLYDRYVHTQSERVKKMLEGRGLVVDTLGTRKRVTSH